MVGSANIHPLGGGREDKRNQERSKDVPHFERSDGCWFDFSILVDESQKPAEIVGFGFEMRFPDRDAVEFLRFDFNLPNHDNDDRGMRFHVHPGSDDFAIHSPPIAPLEILQLFLYGCGGDRLDESLPWSQEPILPMAEIEAAIAG